MADTFTEDHDLSRIYNLGYTDSMPYNERLLILSANDDAVSIETARLKVKSTHTATRGRARRKRLVVLVAPYGFAAHAATGSP